MTIRDNMYGKLFDSLYTGSMIGAGCPVFAVWGYVIANMKPDLEVGAQVELNPELLRFILGATREEIEGAIRKLCAPDPKSRTKAEEGRRLVKLGEFAYRVVNGPKYVAIKNAEAQREAARDRKRKQRAKLNIPTAGEREAIKAAENGDQEGYDRQVTASLPEVARGDVSRGTVDSSTEPVEVPIPELHRLPVESPPHVQEPDPDLNPEDLQ